MYTYMYVKCNFFLLDGYITWYVHDIFRNFTFKWSVVFKKTLGKQHEENNSVRFCKLGTFNKDLFTFICHWHLAGDTKLCPKIAFHTK